MNYRQSGILCLIILPFLHVSTLAAEEADSTRRDWLRETEVAIEASGTASKGDFAPLWLTANRYGMSSVRPFSAYLRASIGRDITHDAARDWRIGYGLDVAITAGHERRGILQQYYVEGAWRNIRLTIGAKQQPLEILNPELGSGEMSLGINARPVPQVRLDIDWFSFPGTKGWWKWRLFGSYGWKTDGPWQESWVEEGKHYTRHSLYHEKALYWKFGRPDIFPLTYEFGLRMATEFGGDFYNYSRTGSYLHGARNLKAYWQALTEQGFDETDGHNPNVAGNTVGSYIMQLCYHGSRWQARAYWERFFEDHSMLTVQYGIRDMLIGGEVTVPKNPFLTSVVLEFMSSTDQSGAVFHDPTNNIPEKVAGRDNYYNHNLFSGWQNYGQTFGNPFFTSPLYNAAFGEDHNLNFYNNRIKAWHFALAGDPSPEWHWRAKASFTRNWGTYYVPFDEIRHQQYFMAEATYRPRWATGWQASLGVGLDHGDLIGNSVGTQLTIRKSLTLKK